MRPTKIIRTTYEVEVSDREFVKLVKSHSPKTGKCPVRLSNSSPIGSFYEGAPKERHYGILTTALCIDLTPAEFESVLQAREKHTKAKPGK